ncbi:MAG: hypothetical protein IPG71_04825 [bacterium]|nr:hypothetical protein [bacterium]
MRAGMGVVIIGGLLSSLLLSLVLVPVMYTVLDGLSKKSWNIGEIPQKSGETAPALN